jgi:hypothetical protein
VLFALANFNDKDRHAVLRAAVDRAAVAPTEGGRVKDRRYRARQLLAKRASWADHGLDKLG